MPVLTRVAAELPLHATAVGKVLLAFSPPELTERVIAQGLTKHAPNTITDPERLRADLAEVRRTGLAYTVEEMSIGTCSVAAPVYGPGEEVVAALSRGGLAAQRGRQAFGPAVRSAARALSKDLAAKEPERTLTTAYFRSAEAKPGRGRPECPRIEACELRSASSGPGPPACCCPICCTCAASTRWSWRSGAAST